MAKKPLTIGGREITNADWKAGKVDPATLPPDLAKLYAKVAAAQAATKEAQEAFEAATVALLAAKVGKGRKLFIGYRFGLTIMPIDGNTSGPVATGLFT